MIEFEVTLRDRNVEINRGYYMTEEQAAATGDRELLETVSKLVLQDVIQEWRVPGSTEIE